MPKAFLMKEAWTQHNIEIMIDEIYIRFRTSTLIFPEYVFG